MSENTPEDTTSESPVGVDDEALPDDLVPGDDNPLAEGLGDGETVGDLLGDGKHAEQDEETTESSSTTGSTSSTSSTDEDEQPASDS